MLARLFEKAMRRGRLHIGTSGWHYAHWVGRFYPTGTPSKDFLTYYTRHFRSVEINNTFYHLPAPETLAQWHDRTPARFVFACKASRFITHMKKLSEPEQSVARFFDTIAVLGDKLGPVLFQLPPRWHVNLDRLEAFLRALPAGHRYAFECRDQSWCIDEAYAVLAAHNAAFCIYDLAYHQSPQVVTADFVYIRLHGPDGAYRGQYDTRVLRKWARQAVVWRDAGKDVYCYFDNDEAGYAAGDAQRLQEMLKG